MEAASEFFKNWQQAVIQGLCGQDSALKIQEDNWKRPTQDSSDGGGGITRVLRSGKIFESGGVNFSEVYGKVEGELAKAFAGHSGEDFYATGTSIVIHPWSPAVPTVHANLRFMQVGKLAWFGGGMDLTPYMYNPEIFRHFHKTIKIGCDQHDKEYYPKFKKWCDEYFFIAHRQETRGIGGVFFDNLGIDNPEKQPEYFKFVKTMGSCFNEAYLPIVEATKELPFSNSDKEFQQIRHGRYVEFNLVYDRGTKFGLQSNGRTESILMSLPKSANWTYCWEPAPGGAAEKLMHVFREPLEWC